MIFGLSGSQLFGVGLAVIGMVVLAFSGRYVWRTTGIYRAEAVSTLGDGSRTLVRISGTAQEGDADLLSARPSAGATVLPSGTPSKNVV